MRAPLQFIHRRSYITASNPLYLSMILLSLPHFSPSQWQHRTWPSCQECLARLRPWMNLSQRLQHLCYMQWFPGSSYFNRIKINNYSTLLLSCNPTCLRSSEFVRLLGLSISLNCRVIRFFHSSPSSTIMQRLHPPRTWLLWLRVEQTFAYSLFFFHWF